MRQNNTISEETPQGERRATHRKCIVTGEELPKESLVRFVLGPDGKTIVPDVLEKLPGRGLWVTASRTVLADAIRKGAFAKAARQPVAADDALTENVGAQLRRQAIAMLHMCKRGGLLVQGFEKVRDMLAKGEAQIVITASDAGEDGQAKLAGPSKDLPHIRLFSRRELGEVAGREQAVHVAIARGRLAKVFLSAAARAAAFDGIEELRQTAEQR